MKRVRAISPRKAAPWIVGLLGFLVIGIWWLVDAFLIPGIATRVNQDLATRLSRV